MKGMFRINRRCPVCGHDFHPEPGYFLGAMMVSFLATAMLMVPTIVALKVAGVETTVLLVVPAIQYVIVGAFLLRYSRVLWLHLEHSTTRRLEERPGPR